MKDNKVSIGFLTALSYREPRLDPYEEFIKFKRHPFIANIIKNGKVIEQGARTVPTGGYFTIPGLSVDGGVFVGSCASIHNTPGLKGIHVSMKSGMLAAEAIMKAIEKNSFTEKALGHYHELFEKSWAKKEIFEGRNFSQGLSKKGLLKFVFLGAQYLTKGRGIYDNMPVEEDCKTLEIAKNSAHAGKNLDKNVFDGVLYVDKLTGVYLSKTMHREDQPCHIIVHDKNLCVNQCYTDYQCPCTRFCPGDVYEIEIDEKTSQKTT